ncbi:MAG: hypothetical protein DRQ78_11375 [Epsilonproteobacteria bacterium]|nr:MAG: hypothetical protein DRQ78_11375 [Campylobacterota bacterium]
MKNLLLITLITTFGISEGFFNHIEMKPSAQTRLCQVFDATAKEYQKTIGSNDAAQTKLNIYKKRAAKVCPTSYVRNTAKKENARLCKVFNQKAKSYKQNMRDDTLAKDTLSSYEKRASEFCKAS